MTVAVGDAANNFDMRGFITLPLFHNHGLSSFFRALYAGKVIYFYNPNLPLSARQLTAVAEEFRLTTQPGGDGPGRSVQVLEIGIDAMDGGGFHIRLGKYIESRLCRQSGLQGMQAT